jgi:hypothetical protein
MTDSQSKSIPAHNASTFASQHPAAKRGHSPTKNNFSPVINTLKTALAKMLGARPVEWK